MGRSPASGSTSSPTSSRFTHYLKLLGLDPGATLEQVNTNYYMLVKQHPENPTSFALPGERSRGRGIAVSGAVLLLILGGVVLALNRGNLVVAMTQYEPGQVLRWQNQPDPYGTVLRFEKAHRFPVGEPSGAYEIQLTGQPRQTIWLSERLVEKSLTPTESQAVPAVGVTTPSR